MGAAQFALEGRVEADRQNRSVYVLVHGPEPVSDSELLESAREELAKSKQAQAELMGAIQQLNLDLTSTRFRASRAEYRESQQKNSVYDLERQCREERQDRLYLTWTVIALSVIAGSLFVLHIV